MAGQTQKQNTNQSRQSTCTEQHLFNQLQNSGYTRHELHTLVHKIVLHYAQNSANQPQQKTQHKNKRIPQHLQHIQQHQPHTFIQRIFLFIINIKGKALCLLHTQFAKKPKNPV